MCFIGGPMGGRVEDTGDDVRVGDNFIGTHIPLTDVTLMPRDLDLKPDRVEYHHYRCVQVAGPFGLYSHVGQITEQQVAEMMPRHFDWDPRRGLIHKVPLEDRPTE